MNFHECRDRTLDWAQRVGIHRMSTERAQVGCFLEEVREAYLAPNPQQLKSEIGDIAVTLVNADNFELRQLASFRLNENPAVTEKNPLAWCANAGLMGHYDLAMKELVVYATKKGFNILECWIIALDKIEKREQMIFEKGGKCIKFESMTDHQKEIYKRSKAK